MPVYSHTQLSVYEECPLKYKLRYLDGIKRDTEGIEGFLGNIVHETLKTVSYTHLTLPTKA